MGKITDTGLEEIVNLNSYKEEQDKKLFYGRDASDEHGSQRRTIQFPGVVFEEMENLLGSNKTQAKDVSELVRDSVFRILSHHAKNNQLSEQANQYFEQTKRRLAKEAVIAERERLDACLVLNDKLLQDSQILNDVVTVQMVINDLEIELAECKTNKKIELKALADRAKLILKGM